MLTTKGANDVLAFIKNNNCYLGLSSTDPATAFTEPPTEDGYARVEISQFLGEPLNKQMKNTEAIVMTECINNAWTDISYFGIFRSRTGAVADNLILYGALTNTEPLTVAVGKVPVFRANQLVLEVE